MEPKKFRLGQIGIGHNHGQGHIEALLRIVLIKGIVGITVAIQKCERDWTFAVRETIDIAGGKVVFRHEVTNDVTDMVITDFTDEGDRHSEAA